MSTLEKRQNAREAAAVLLTLTLTLHTWSRGARCDLREYRSTNVFGKTKDDNIGLLEQFCGLANALRLIHSLTFSGPTASDPNLSATHPPATVPTPGWHHDLKAENILYFEDANLKYKNFLLSQPSHKIN